MAHKIVAVLNDLMFTVKISDAARRVGVPVEFAKSADEAVHKAEGADAVILDLNFVPPDLIPKLKPAHLIGYVSHVQTDVIQRARESGCDTVMARSAFVQGLDRLLQDLAGHK